MKSTGIVRPLDQLGRVVIPIELRRTFNIDTKDGLEIHTEGDYIVLKKFKPHCVLCGNTVKLVIFKEKNICRNCIDDIK